MAIVAGIDEAGYGPMLGPLVVSATAFRVPEEKAADDLWRVLQIGRSTDRRKTRAGVKVADSKELHTGDHGFRLIEENLLPFIRALIGQANGFPGILQDLCAEGRQVLLRRPWYRGRELKLPHKANPQRVIDRTVQLKRALGEARSAFCGARAEVLPAAEFNRDVAETGNKSSTLWKRVGRLIQYLWEEFGGEGVRLVVDKQGGRSKYGVLLRYLFPNVQITMNTESAVVSSYWIEDADHALSIIFQPKADRDNLPTALASMMSKYIRELCMELFNDFWLDRVPGLRPTAGYVADARRFLKDIDGTIGKEGIARELFVRSR